jgi:hypothetical protein
VTQAEIGSYLEQVRTRLHLGVQTEKRIVRELYTHFQDKTTDLERQGIPRSAAAHDAIESLGDPKVMARLMYEAYSGSSWLDALVGAQPYLFAACLFATGLWHNPVALAVYFLAIAAVTLYGWLNGTPSWLYNWAAHCMLSVASAGYLLRTVFAQIQAPLTASWPAVPFLLLMGGTTWMAVSILLRAARRDWIFVSLILMPLPLVGLWLLPVQPLLRLFHHAGEQFHVWDPLMASCWLLMAVVSTIFARLRSRFFKLAALLIGSECVLVWAARRIWAGATVIQLVAIASATFLLLLSPAILHLHMSSGSRRTTGWLQEWSEEPPDRE